MVEADDCLCDKDENDCPWLMAGVAYVVIDERLELKEDEDLCYG